MVLSDTVLNAMLYQLVKEADHTLINPASVDIRIGKTLMYEKYIPFGSENTELALMRSDKDIMSEEVDLSQTTPDSPYWLGPGEFALVSTYETVMVPNGYAIELKLKSSTARKGFNHSLAFWVDPGWNGILTMEIQNVLQRHHIPLWYGMRFAQMIVHLLERPATYPYGGRYQNAAQVQAAKYTGVVNDPVHK